MRTDTVGQPIFYLDTDAHAAPVVDTQPDHRSIFQASASEVYGPEAGGLLADRIENLMAEGASTSRPVVLACVREDIFEVAIIGEHEQEVMSFPIPSELSPAEVGESMSSMISLVVTVSGGVTDMLVNQIFCLAHSDPLSALQNS